LGWMTRALERNTETGKEKVQGRKNKRLKRKKKERRGRRIKKNSHSSKPKPFPVLPPRGGKERKTRCQATPSVPEEESKGRGLTCDPPPKKVKKRQKKMANEAAAVTGKSGKKNAPKA